MFSRILFAISMIALLAGMLAAQVITGSIYGTVTDPTGAVVANARVVATSAERGNTRSAIYVQFRAEVFNATNTPIFKNPTTTVGGSLGKITSTSGGDRRLQFALKVVF
jgi:hypothetical protein